MLGSIEIRQEGEGRRLVGSFPYGATATVRDRGRLRKERFLPGAFDWSVREFARLKEAGASVEELHPRNISILRGHSFDQPLGDLLSGSARVVSTRQSLDFEVNIPDDPPTYFTDLLKQIDGGIVAAGISPGFRIPPRSAVADAERYVPEPGNPGVEIREIREAVLFEVSVVSRPSYSETSVDVRGESRGTTPSRLPSERTLWL